MKSFQKAFSSIYFIVILFCLSSCQLLLRHGTKKDFPYSSLDKKITAVSQSMSNLTKIEDLDVGLFISQKFLYSQIKNAVDTINKKNWSNDYVESVEIHFDQEGLVMEEESIQLDFITKFNISDKIANINTLQTQFSATISISSSNDTIYLYPHFDFYKLLKGGFDGKKLIKKYRKKKETIALLFKTFNDELNAQLGVRPISVPLDLGIVSEKAVKDLFSSSPNQTIISDDTLNVDIQLENISVHTENSGLYVMADLRIKKEEALLNRKNDIKSLEAYALNRKNTKRASPIYVVSDKEEFNQLSSYSSSILSSKSLDDYMDPNISSAAIHYRKPVIFSGYSSSISNISMEKTNTLQSTKPMSDGDFEDLLRAIAQHIEEERLKKKRLEEVLVEYDKTFDHLWHHHFDSVKDSKLSVGLQKSFISELFNYTMNNDVKFSVLASNQSVSEFNKQNIRVGKATVNDRCSEIKNRHCNKDRCHRHSCCSCKWYKPHCCACNALYYGIYLGCKIHAEAKYLACKANNYGKYIWCKTKVFGDKLFNELAKVGDVEGKVDAAGTIRIDYNYLRLSPDLTSFYLDSNISGRGRANINLRYDPEGLVGWLLCPGGIPRTFNKSYDIYGIKQELDVGGSIEQINASNKASMKITTESESIFLIMSPPPAVSIFTDPKWTFSCPLAVLGIKMGTFAAALFGNPDLKKQALAGLTGLYDYQVEPMDFEFSIDAVNIKPTAYTSGIRLLPEWGEKTIAFKSK